MEQQISLLKEQINNLQQNEKDYQDLNFLFTNLEHRYNILLEEKNRLEQDYLRRSDFNMQSIAAYRAEVDSLREELSQERMDHAQYKEQIQFLMYENQQLTDEVNNLRDAYTKIVQQIQEQDEQYQQTLVNKQQYIDNLSYQLKQINDLKQQQEKKLLTDIESKHQQHWRVDKYLNEIENYKSQNEKLNIENKQSNKQVERLEQQINNYKDQMIQMTNEIGKLQHSIHTLSKDVKDKNSKYQGKSSQQLQQDQDAKRLQQINQQLVQKIDHQQEQLEILMQNNQQLILECDQLRSRLNDIEQNKMLVQTQYAKSLNKMQEERRVIKDYLQRQKILRENRIQNENDVSKCLEEITKGNTQRFY
ncbi:hypothetical protein pb186bvf_000533 [Paramecium bursaria]